MSDIEGQLDIFQAIELQDGKIDEDDLEVFVWPEQNLNSPGESPIPLVVED